MNYIKKFFQFLKESSITAEQPTASSLTQKEITKPKVPTKPAPPVKPSREKIEQPSETPQRKAVTEMDVVKRFIKETNQMGESVEKYIR